MMAKKSSVSLVTFPLLLTLSLISPISCLGQVVVVFQTISNPGSILFDNSTCRNNKCNLKVKVTFNEPDTHTYKTDYIELEGNKTLPQTGAGALNDGAGTEFDNPVTVSCPAQKKLEQFGVSIQVDDYSNYRKVKMARLDLTESVTTGVIYNRSLTDNAFTMTLSYKVICEENYYFDCSVFCTSRDDNLGHYTCDPVTGGKVCMEGWTGDDCLTKTCTSDLNITGGHVTSTVLQTYKVDDTVTVECDDGFELNSSLQSNIITCLDTGDWSFDDFDNICTEKVKCSSTLNITSGSVTSTLQTTYYVHDTVTVECDDGFELNSSLQSNVLTCLDTGDWSFNDFDNICEEIQGCSAINSPHLLTNTTENTALGPGQVVRLSCEAGYVLLQADNSTTTTYLDVKCQEGGAWQPHLPSCQQADQVCAGCSKLRDPIEGTLSYSSRNACGEPSTGSTVRANCNQGYVLIEFYQGLTCTESGEWADGSGNLVEEGPRHLIDCIASGETEAERIEESLSQTLGQGALIVAGITLLAFSTFISVYCFVHQRQKKKTRVSPRGKLNGNGGKGTVKSAGIGQVERGLNVSPVEAERDSAAYVNQGFVCDDFDYDF